MKSLPRFASLPVHVDNAGPGRVISIAKRGEVPLLEYRARYAVRPEVPALPLSAIIRDRFVDALGRAGVGAHIVEAVPTFGSVRVSASCHAVHMNKLLACVPGILARPLTGDELQSADFIFTEHMSDLARDEQSRLSADLYHLAGWGIGSGLRIASGLESWAGLPPSRFLASPQAVTVVAPTYAELEADLPAHLADTDDWLPIPVLKMTPAEQVDCGPAASVSLGWVGPAWDEHDFPAFYMAGRLLGGMHDSILMTELRRREGWSYSPWSAVRLRPHSTLLEVQARVGHLHLQRARQIIINAVCDMASTEPGALRTAYAASLGQVIIGMSSQAGLAGTVNHYDFLGIGLPGLDEIFAAASRVTPGDLGKAADRYLRADQAIGPHHPS